MEDFIRYIPHTEEDCRKMLETIGVTKVEDFFEMLFVEKLDFENEVKNNILPSFQEHMNFIEKEFRNNVRQGFIRLVDPEDAAYMVFATLRAYSLRWLFQGMKGKLTDKRDVIYDLVMKGLSAE